MTNTEANKIYNSFPKEQRDVPRSEFVKRLIAATSQTGVDRDLAQIMHGKRVQRNIEVATRRGTRA